MKSGIYQIYSLINGRRYVGSAVNLYRRRREHYNDLKNKTHANRHFQNAYNKYGRSAFKYSVLELVEDANTLIEREQVWIDSFDWGNLYNINSNAGSRLGTRWSKESRKKVSGKGNSMYGKYGKDNPNYGSKRSAETRKKISEKAKGRTGKKNHRSTMLTFNGKTQNITAWAKDRDMRISTLSYRIREGWSVKRALTTPILGN